MILTLVLDGSPSNVMALVSIVATHENALPVKVTMSMEAQPPEYDSGLGPQDILAMPIEDLDLSVRAYNNIKRAELDTLRDLVAWTRAEIAMLGHNDDHATGMNDQATTEVVERLTRYGLSLTPEPKSPAARAK